MDNYNEFKKAMDGFSESLVGMGGSVDTVIEICNIQLKELEYNPNAQLENNIKRWINEQKKTA